MSIYVLVTGVIGRQPEARRSKNGDVFVGTTLRVPDTGDGAWWRISAFSESAQEELLRLNIGDAVAIQGGMRIERYEKDGDPRLGLAIRADRVTALRPHDRGGSVKPQSVARHGQYDHGADEPDPF